MRNRRSASNSNRREKRKSKNAMCEKTGQAFVPTSSFWLVLAGWRSQTLFLDAIGVKSFMLPPGASHPLASTLLRPCVGVDGTPPSQVWRLLIESLRNDERVGVGVGRGIEFLIGDMGNAEVDVSVRVDGVEGMRANVSLRVGEAGKMNNVWCGAAEETCLGRLE